MEQIAPNHSTALVELHNPPQMPPKENAAAIGDSNLDCGDALSTINVQTWLNHSPWRITSAWSAVAGLLSMGIATSIFDWRTFLDWQMIALTILLVDPLWGGIWRFAWGRDGILPLRNGQEAQGFWLPYLKPDSPAGRLMGIPSSQQQSRYLEEGSSRPSGFDSSVDNLAPLLFRIGLPTLLLAYGVAATLGTTALLLTTTVIVCAIFGWLGRRSVGRPAVLLQIIVTIALPWVLLVFLLRERLLLQQSGVEVSELRIYYSFLLMILWSIHCWGIAAARRYATNNILNNSQDGQDAHKVSDNVGHQSLEVYRGEQQQNQPIQNVWRQFSDIIRKPALPLLLIGDIGLISLMLFLREPLWLALMVPLWLPTWFSYLQGTPLDRQPIWRLIALLMSAIAIGQTPLT